MWILIFEEKQVKTEIDMVVHIETRNFSLCVVVKIDEIS